MVRHLIGKVQIFVPFNYNVNLHFAALFGKVFINDKTYRVENNHIQVLEETKKDNYAVNIYVSTLIGDVEVVYR